MPNYEITMDVEDSGSGTIVDPTQLNDAGNAKRAEAWAVGQRNGVDVPSTDPTYHNNSKYYAQQAGSSAGSASSSADAAAAAAQHYPYVDSTSGNWMVWDTSTSAFVDTGVHAQGQAGPTGPGVPSGGTAGQVLKKVNGTDYNTEWSNNDGTTIPMSSSDSTSINEAISNKLGMNSSATFADAFSNASNGFSCGYVVSGATDNPFSSRSAEYMQLKYSSTFGVQIATNHVVKSMYYRTMDGGTFSPWMLLGVEHDPNNYYTSSSITLSALQSAIDSYVAERVNLGYSVSKCLFGYANTTAATAIGLSGASFINVEWQGTSLIVVRFESAASVGTIQWMKKVTSWSGIA